MALTTKYQARSFEDLVKPLQEYAKAYAEQENALAALNDEASTLEQQMALEGDTEAGRLYNGYIGDLHNAVNDLSKNGLSLASRNNLLKMRQRYASEVTPVVNAIEARNKAIEAHNALDAVKNNRYIGNSPLDFGISDYLFDRRPDVYGLNGKDVESNAMELAKTSSGRATRFLTSADGRYKITKNGLSQDEVSQITNALVTGTEVQDPFLQGVMKDIENMLPKLQEQYGFDKLQNDELKSRFLSEALNGFFKGIIGDEKYEEDKYALAAFQSNLDYQKQLKLQQSKPSTTKGKEEEYPEYAEYRRADSFLGSKAGRGKDILNLLKLDSNLDTPYDEVADSYVDVVDEYHKVYTQPSVYSQTGLPITEEIATLKRQLSELKFTQGRGSQVDRQRKETALYNLQNQLDTLNSELEARKSTYKNALTPSEYSKVTDALGGDVASIDEARFAFANTPDLYGERYVQQYQISKGQDTEINKRISEELKGSALFDSKHSEDYKIDAVDTQAGITFNNSQRKTQKEVRDILDNISTVYITPQSIAYKEDGVPKPKIIIRDNQGNQMAVSAEYLSPTVVNRLVDPGFINFTEQMTNSGIAPYYDFGNSTLMDIMDSVAGNVRHHLGNNITHVTTPASSSLD